MLDEILTIGVYGLTSDEFFNAIDHSGTDCFVDIRQRRGLRGSQYAFANSARLQSELARRGVAYVHIKELAPTDAVRQAQKDADAMYGVGKRQRECLGEAFKMSYCRSCLEEWSVKAFIHALPLGVRRPMLFCVERMPQACHRSLAAEWISKGLGISVKHIGA